MAPIVYLDKAHVIIQLLLYVIVLPLIFGVVIGSITGKMKPHATKMTLLITAVISLIFFSLILMTLQNQSIPALAIILTVVIIIIVNGSAIVSHKLVSKKVEKK